MNRLLSIGSLRREMMRLLWTKGFEPSIPNERGITVVECCREIYLSYGQFDVFLPNDFLLKSLNDVSKEMLRQIDETLNPDRLWESAA